MELITLQEAKFIMDSLKGSLNAEIYLEGKLVDSIDQQTSPSGLLSWTATVGDDNYPSPYLINTKVVELKPETLFEYESLDMDRESYDDLRDEWRREDIWNEKG